MIRRIIFFTDRWCFFRIVGIHSAAICYRRFWRLCGGPVCEIVILIVGMFRRRLNDGIGWISACIPSIPVAFMIPFKDNFICVGKRQDAGLSAVIIHLKAVTAARHQQTGSNREHFLTHINATFQTVP